MKRKLDIAGFLRTQALALLQMPRIKRLADHFTGVRNRRETQAPVTIVTKKMATLFVCLILALNFWFLGSNIFHYFSWPFNAYENPNLYNLTAQNLSWDVFYGHSPMCGEKECHLTTSYAKDSYTKQMVLPAREFPLADYKQGQIIYLRAKVEIPQYLFEKNEALVLHALYIWAKKYNFYVNEALVYEGTNELVNISIPRDLIPADRMLNLAFRIDPGNLPYQGLANRTDLFLGLKRDLAKMAFAADELKTTYYLWFLLPIMTLCVVFVLLFLLVSRKPGSLSFILYAFTTSAIFFFRSDYPNVMLPWQQNWANTHLVLEAVALVFLLRFIHDFFYERDQFFRWKTSTALITVLSITIGGLYFLPSSQATTLIDFLIVILRESTVVYGTYLAFLCYLVNAAKEDNHAKTHIATFLTCFFIISFVVVTTWSILNSISLIFGADSISSSLVRSAFNLIKIYDLVFFVVLAAINTMEVGFSMARKDYIERELQDAANMARAFQPDAKPNWAQFTIDVFHRPLSEASGDYFAFRQDSSGKFMHHIIFDITGHGIQAALVVSTVKTVLNQMVSQNAALLASLDFIPTTLQMLASILFEQGKGHHTVTAAGVTFEKDSNTCHFLLAGHPFPLLVRSTNAEKMEIKPMIFRSALLGASENPGKMVLQKQELKPGDSLIFYTDGLPLKMAQNALQTTIKAATDQEKKTISAEQLFKTAWATERAKSGRRPDDDASVVVISYHGEAAKTLKSA